MFLEESLFRDETSECCEILAIIEKVAPNVGSVIFWLGVCLGEGCAVLENRCKLICFVIMAESFIRIRTLQRLEARCDHCCR